MKQTITETRIEARPETIGALEYILREGARKLLQAALEAEIEEHLTRYKDLVWKLFGVPRRRGCRRAPWCD